ncbi:hypothetical protein ACHAXS_002593 [Conticribra weissflogii]
MKIHRYAPFALQDLKLVKK